MKKIEKSIDNEYIKIEYDENEYDVEILSSQMKAILKRKLDGEIITCHVFDLKDEYKIKQIDGHNVFYTITNDGTYTFYRSFDTHLYLTWQFESIKLAQPIKNGVFVLYNADDIAVIYNAITNKMSNELPSYSIDTNAKIMDYIDPKYHSTVLIREEVEKGIAKDTITYGLDVDDMDLATKVWSVEQQRYIKKYNTKEAIKYLKNKGKKIVIEAGAKTLRGEITLINEVDKYLKLLDEQGIYNIYPNQDKDIMVYDDEEGHIPNKEHLKHLRRDYRIKK